MVEEEGSRSDLAHKSAKITSSSGGQMSIYSIFEREAVGVLRVRVHVRCAFSGGAFRSVGTSRGAYRQLTAQQGRHAVCGGGGGGY